MIDELDALPLIHPDDKISWNEHKDIFFKNYQSKESTAIQAPMHDILKIGGGVPATSVFAWHILGELLSPQKRTLADSVYEEWLPLFKRLELIKGQWKSIFFPPNMGGTRDIPAGAEFHASVKARLAACKDYRPRNDGFKP